MTVYKENILEIVENWNDYPLQPPSCDADLGDLPPAKNAGVVELKCFINNTCPFYAAGYKEDALVFNNDTYDRIQPWLPEELKNALMVTPSLPGIHFRPRWVFRHNYIYQKVKVEDGKVVKDTAPIHDLFDKFDENYREITQIENSTSYQPGADQTRYKAEQSWVVMKSIFDIPNASSAAEECDAQAEWGYYGQKVSDSEITDDDLAYDYNKEYYDAYDDSWDLDSNPLKLKPGEHIRINKYRAQMPVQKRVLSEINEGVHWNLRKRTQLFQGEDFFIRFHKQASDTVSNPNRSDKEGIQPFPYEFEKYWPLDVTRDDLLNMSSKASGIPDLMRKRNMAVAPPTIGTQTPDYKKFDFHDQAYYIIELGVGSQDNNYFIIITQRANPIFVNFVQAAPDDAGVSAVVSKKLSEFTQISGAQLIQSKSFDMSVRNHLGSIVIQFSGEGINVPPWVIKRTDWIPDVDPVSNDPYLKDKSRHLFVPKGKMSIMGGNIRCGFIFGPLQYSTNYVTMIYPPREQFGVDEKNMALAWDHDKPERIRARSMGGAFKSSPFFLPTQGNHDIMFSSTDIFLEGLNKSVIPVGQANVNQPLFTQDSQFYKNYYESNDPTKPRADEYRFGAYFFENPLREFSEMPTADSVNTSNIIAKKYRYLDDPKTRQQAFDILVGMMTGDHIFIQDFWWDIPTPPPGQASDNLSRVDYSSIPDNEWFLESCKTPILTSLRLVSHESADPRWADGTSTMSGINFTPENGESPYFVDATDHVMSFSDSWSASGFSEMEHTGSINFYLNRGMPVEKNVTDELMALQNKTFYIEIWAGYTRGCPDTGYQSYSRQDGMFKLFTGLCHGGDIDYQYGKNIMSCKIEDYTAVLKGSRFFNSPWFDGVKDINCIREILQMSAFRDVGKYDPGSLIGFLSHNTNSGGYGVFFHHFDGRLFKMEPYALPSGYNRLDQPAFKFNDGDPFMDAVVKIAKRAAKVFFFDQFGIAHYENFQDIIQSDYLGKVPISPLCVFTTNPEKWPGQLVFNKLERNYDVGGVANHIKIMSNTPDFYLLIGDDLNWSSMDDPNSEGFIGYLKSIYQQESMFGSKEAMMDTIRKYSVSFRPKIKSKFETYGVPLRANDIIQINGENTRVIKVSNTITAEKNEWWMEVETEKYQIVQASRTVA